MVSQRLWVVYDNTTFSVLVRAIVPIRKVVLKVASELHLSAYLGAAVGDDLISMVCGWAFLALSYRVDTPGYRSFERSIVCPSNLGRWLRLPTGGQAHTSL